MVLRNLTIVTRPKLSQKAKTPMYPQQQCPLLTKKKQNKNTGPSVAIQIFLSGWSVQSPDGSVPLRTFLLEVEKNLNCN